MDQGQVNSQLERILASPQFAHSGRLSRFLRLVIEAALSADAEPPKEYRIGVEVFDRGKDFDPRIDPIVRVQAAKLRSKLLEYYASPGAQDPIVVTIPRGGYSAEIRAQSRVEPAPSHPGLPALPPLSRIAVLPFVNMSADPENEYFSDGLTEELINRLACVPRLQVVARTSAFRFKGRNEDIREVGAQLNVGAIMEGSVRKDGNQLRITAQLIDVESGFHLFSRTYQLEFKGIFELQDEIAAAVVREIVPSSPGPRAVSAPGNLEAYNLYLRAVHALSNRFADWGPAIQMLREVVSMDSSYAAAWSGLAHAYYLSAWFYKIPTLEAVPLCREAATKALQLNPDIAEAQSSLAMVESGFDWNWQQAESRFQRAIELQPSLPITYTFYAVVCLLPQLKLQRACSMADRALALDPLNPLSLAQATYIYSRAGRFEEALRLYALGQEIKPDFPPNLGSGGLAYDWSGNLPEAIRCFRKLCEATNYLPATASFLSNALAQNGQLTEARNLLDRTLQRPDKPDLDIARLYSGLREKEETLCWLERAVDNRDIHMVVLPSDRAFSWLRPDPRFRKILDRMRVALEEGPQSPVRSKRV